MAADSGTYTPETLQRRLKIAEQLTKPINKPIYHWAQGLGEIGEGALGGYMLNRAEKAEKEGAAAQGQALLSMLGGGQQAPSPAAPGPEAPAAPPRQAPGPMADGSMPRGLRNNNPLNIEAGNFTQSQPGFSGSDGRFAKFETPEAGVGAANKLLDVYQNKHGLNTPAGIIGRWAPAGDGNNVSSYAQAVAQKLGIGPNDPIPPEMRPQLIAAMGQHENGRPIGDVAKALLGQPQQMAQASPAAPPGAPGAAAQGGDQRAQIAQMLNNPNPYVQRMGRQLAQEVVKTQLEPNKFGFQMLPDGTMVRTDPRTGAVTPTFQAPSKPTFGIIGEDQFGNKQHGWIDPYKKTVEPAAGTGGTPGAPAAPATVTDANGKVLTVPPGQDPKKFREHVTTATADAMSGKLTEVQANATQFANRMEDAEKNISGLEDQAGGITGAAQQIAGKVPVIGAAMQSEKYQKFDQAKSQFITALLRKESGAAISPSEFARYEKEFFPQPGNTQEVIEQKRQARKVAVDAMKKGTGPMYKPPEGAQKAPQGVDPKVWGVMTPEERALWK